MASADVGGESSDRNTGERLLERFPSVGDALDRVSGVRGYLDGSERETWDVGCTVSGVTLDRFEELAEASGTVRYMQPLSMWDPSVGKGHGETVKMAGDRLADELRAYPEGLDVVVDDLSVVYRRDKLTYKAAIEAEHTPQTAIREGDVGEEVRMEVNGTVDAVLLHDEVQPAVEALLDGAGLAYDTACREVPVRSKTLQQLVEDAETLQVERRKEYVWRPGIKREADRYTAGAVDADVVDDVLGYTDVMDLTVQRRDGALYFHAAGSTPRKGQDVVGRIETEQDAATYLEGAGVQRHAGHGQ